MLALPGYIYKAKPPLTPAPKAKAKLNLSLSTAPSDDPMQLSITNQMTRQQYMEIGNNKFMTSVSQKPSRVRTRNPSPDVTKIPKTRPPSGNRKKRDRKHIGNASRGINIIGAQKPTAATGSPKSEMPFNIDVNPRLACRPNSFIPANHAYASCVAMRRSPSTKNA